MSESFSVFVKKVISFPEMRASLEGIMNLPLNRAESKDWELYSAQLLGLDITLAEVSDYEDDRDLRFTQYDYEISVEYVRNAIDVHYAQHWRLLGALVIGSMVSKKLNCECMVVRDMQELLERFLPDEIEDGPL